MDDDTAPRRTPPPKPTVLQLSTPKPEVPEVSLMFDSDDSLIWQVSRPSSLKEKEHSFENYAKKDKMQFSNQSRMVTSAQLPVTEDLINATGKNYYNMYSIPRKPQVTSGHCAPFPRVENKMTEDMTSETRTSERRFQNSQMHKPCDVASPLSCTGITGNMNERLYNPQVYSPVQEKVANKASADGDSHGVKQKDFPLTSNFISGTQQHPNQTEKNISPQTRPLRNVLSPHIFNSRPPSPPVIKRVMFSQDNFSNSPVETKSDSANKTNTFPVDLCLPQNQNNKENINPPFPVDQQPRVPIDNRAYTSENVSNHYYSPTPISCPAQASQYNILEEKRYNGLIKQGYVYPEPSSYSPHSFNGRFYSSPDPMVYRLIEDQNQQILKLTKTIERIVEKQQEDKSPKDVSSRKLASSKVIHSMEGDEDQDNFHKDIATQTLATSMPEKRCVGVNTDLSWSDLVASTRNCDILKVGDHWGFNSDERCNVPKEIKSNNMNKDSPRGNVDRDKYQSKHKLNMDGRNSALQGIMSQSSNQEGASLTEEGVMLATQEDRRRSHPSHPVGMPEYHDKRVPEELADRPRSHPSLPVGMPEYHDKRVPEELADRPRSHPSLPVGTPKYHDKRVPEELAGYLRNDGKRTVEFGSSLALGETASTYRNNVQNQTSKPSSHPLGVTFYNNVLTNIQQILQSSKTSPEGREHKQSDEDDQQASRLAEGSTEKILPDPQIEAVRKQLLQFGISFIDPASLATDHTTILDTMYLPGVHNMLSLYKSTVSTHYQTPYQETDATAAKYLTDSQLAAIAAMSPAMTKRSRGAGTSHDYPIPAEDINTQERRTQSQLYKFTMSNNFSMATRKFLDRYGLQDD